MSSLFSMASSLAFSFCCGVGPARLSGLSIWPYSRSCSSCSTSPALECHQPSVMVRSFTAHIIQNSNKHRLDNDTFTAFSDQQWWSEMWRILRLCIVCCKVGLAVHFKVHSNVAILYRHLYINNCSLFLQSVSLVGFDLWSFDHIHSGYFHSASSSPLLLRGALDTAWILCWSFMPKRHRQLQVKDLPKVPMCRASNGYPCTCLTNRW